MVKVFHVHIYDSALQEFLESKSNVSEFIRTILDDYRTGKLSYTIDNSKSLKDQKTEQEILSLKLKNQFTLKTQENKSLKEIEEIMKNPSSFKIEEGNHGLKCPECLWYSSAENSDNEQINQITWHVKHFHKRNLTEKEADELSRLLI